MTMGNSDDENGEICLTENMYSSRAGMPQWFPKHLRLAEPASAPYLEEHTPTELVDRFLDEFYDVEKCS